MSGPLKCRSRAHGCRGRHGFAGASRALGVWGPSRGPSSADPAPTDVEGATALPGRPERWGVWGPFRGPHLDGRLAHERGAAHVARLVHGERPGAVHGTTVVP